ncbi:MAG: hypothetical protein WBQ21_00305 [Solirubrobacteraceae bacterium]
MGPITGAQLARPTATYHGVALPDRIYTAAEVDAALAVLIEPGRLAHAQDVVTHAAPTLQRVLVSALAEGGWFGETHDTEISRASSEHDEGERARAVSTLVAEQTQLGMFVGVAVGFELAHELKRLSEPVAGESGAQDSRGGQSGAREPQQTPTPTQEQ